MLSGKLLGLLTPSRPHAAAPLHPLLEVLGFKFGPAVLGGFMSWENRDEAGAWDPSSGGG